MPPLEIRCSENKPVGKHLRLKLYLSRTERQKEEGHGRVEVEIGVCCPCVRTQQTVKSGRSGKAPPPREHRGHSPAKAFISAF